MSDFDDLFALGREVLQDNQGRTVTRHPGGNTGVAGTSVADYLWTELDSRKDESLGHDNVRTGRLEVPDSETVLVTDAWTIDSELWLVKSMGPVEAGLRTVILELVEPVRRIPTAVRPRGR